MLCAIPSHHCHLVFPSVAFLGREDIPVLVIFEMFSLFLQRLLLPHGYFYVCFEVICISLGLTSWITPTYSSGPSSELASSVKLPFTFWAGLGASPLNSLKSFPCQSTCHIVLCAQVSPLQM